MGARSPGPRPSIASVTTTERATAPPASAPGETCHLLTVCPGAFDRDVGHVPMPVKIVREEGDMSQPETSPDAPMRAITISREYGSGGGEIAGRLATRLGWRLVDHEVVVRVARELGVTE